MDDLIFYSDTNLPLNSPCFLQMIFQIKILFFEKMLSLFKNLKNFLHIFVLHLNLFYLPCLSFVFGFKGHYSSNLFTFIFLYWKYTFLTSWGINLKAFMINFFNNSKIIINNWKGNYPWMKTHFSIPLINRRGSMGFATFLAYLQLFFLCDLFLLFLAIITWSSLKRPSFTERTPLWYWLLEMCSLLRGVGLNQ